MTSVMTIKDVGTTTRSVRLNSLDLGEIINNDEAPFKDEGESSLDQFQMEPSIEIDEFEVVDPTDYEFSTFGFYSSSMFSSSSGRVRSRGLSTDSLANALQTHAHRWTQRERGLSMEFNMLPTSLRDIEEIYKQEIANGSKIEPEEEKEPVQRRLAHWKSQPFAGKTPRSHVETPRYRELPQKALLPTGRKIKVHCRISSAQSKLISSKMKISSSTDSNKYKPKSPAKTIAPKKICPVVSTIVKTESETKVQTTTPKPVYDYKNISNLNLSPVSKPKPKAVAGRPKHSSLSSKTQRDIKPSCLSIFARTLSSSNDKNTQDPDAKYVGCYTTDQRRERVKLFLEKRKERVWMKKVKYRCRKKLADSRPRVKGRFVPRAVQNKVLAEQAVTDAEAVVSKSATPAISIPVKKKSLQSSPASRLSTSPIQVARRTDIPKIPTQHNTTIPKITKE